MQQTNLAFPAAAAPLQEDAAASLVLDHLAANPGFQTARELSASLGLSDRQIRRAAELAGGRIVSGPGSPGYCHLDHCTAAQVAHIADTLRSQARHMLARSIRLRKNAHHVIR
jgi:hypothetical protein